jgi:hypothetical protein
MQVTSNLHNLSAFEQPTKHECQGREASACAFLLPSAKKPSHAIDHGVHVVKGRPDVNVDGG